MHSTKTFNAIVAGFALMGSAVAETHQVEVGNNNALLFSPNSTVAAVGDIVEFVFFPKNHSVVQSAFDEPCESESGFYSGFMPVANGQGNSTFRVTVNDTQPIWFYCSQPGGGGHCAKGMVGCVNCPTSGNTLARFAAAAMQTTNETVTQPASVGGGVIAANQGYSGSNGSGGSGSPSNSAGPSGTNGASNPSGTNAAPAVGLNKWASMTIAAGMAAFAISLL